MLITAIDKAVNKKHYAREEEKKRAHEMEQNRMFMEQLNAQNAMFAQSNKDLFGIIGESQKSSNEMFASVMGKPTQVQDDHGGRSGTGEGTFQSHQHQTASMNRGDLSNNGQKYEELLGNGGGSSPMRLMAALEVAEKSGHRGHADLIAGRLHEVMSDRAADQRMNTAAGGAGAVGAMAGATSALEPDCAKPGSPRSGTDGLSQVVDTLRERGGGNDALASKIDTLIALLKEVLGKGKEGTEKTGNGQSDADKAIADANKHYDNAGKGTSSSEGLGDKISDLKKLIQELIDKGILSQSEGEKLMQALDKGQANEVAKALEGGGKNGGGAPQTQAGGAPQAQGAGQANQTPGAQQSFGSQVDALGPQLEKLTQLTGQANEVKGEIDQRVKAGELSMDAGNAAKADIDRGLEDAKRAVLDMGNSNDVHGTKISDDQILGSVGSKLTAMDQNLDKLAASDGKADAARDRLTTQGNNGTISQEEASKGIAAINEKQTATELAVLKW